MRLCPLLRFMLFAAIVCGGVVALEHAHVRHELRSKRCATSDSDIYPASNSCLDITADVLPTVTNDLEQARSRLAQAVFGRPVKPAPSFYNDGARAVAAYFDLVSPRAGLPYRIGYEPLLEDWSIIAAFSIR